MQTTSDGLHKWVKELPRSKMVYPDAFPDRLKYIFWHFFTPHHIFFRDLLIKVGVVQHNGRQDFVLGTVAPDQSLEEFISFLVENGYANHFIALKDEGEVVSLRYVENFAYQHHLRVFEDGEVRAHYEYTPECHPVLHMRAIHWESKRDDFLALLGDRVISPAQS